MNFSVLKGEKLVSEVAARIFQYASASPAAQEQATAALLKANPHLSDMTRVADGSRIAVPDTQLKVNLTELHATAPARVVARSAVVMSERLEAMKTSVPAATASAVAAARNTLAVLERAEVKTAAASDEGLAQRLSHVSQQANASVATAQAIEAEFLKALGPMQERLQNLFKT